MKNVRAYNATIAKHNAENAQIRRENSSDLGIIAGNNFHRGHYLNLIEEDNRKDYDSKEKVAYFFGRELKGKFYDRVKIFEKAGIKFGKMLEMDITYALNLIIMSYEVNHPYQDEFKELIKRYNIRLKKPNREFELPEEIQEMLVRVR